MSIERKEIAPGFSISRIIKGGWQLSQGHSEGNKDYAVDDMFAYADQNDFRIAGLFWIKSVNACWRNFDGRASRMGFN